MISRIRAAIYLLAVSTASAHLALAQEEISTAPLTSVERYALDPSREMLDHGRNVAETACASCHGSDGVGTEPGVPNLAGQRIVYLYRVLQGYQERERHNDTMNHAVGFLNEEALLAVAAWYASLPPARSESTTALETDLDLGGGDPFAGLRDAMKKCVRCHGEDGNASASGMPNLTGQSVEYFVHSMQAYAEGSRDHRLMGRLAEGLDATTLERMGVFYAVQEPARTETVGDGNADRGRELAEPCAVCHGEDGNAGGAEMPTLAGQDARYFTKAMEAYGDGSRRHEAMFEAVESLDASHIADLAAFYAAQNPVRRNVRTPLTTEEWIDRCARCHGIDGNSTDPRFPMLAGQDRTYLANSLQAYVDRGRASSAMHAMAAPLSPSDLRRIVEYYASREPRSVVYMVLPCEEATEP
ncbi:MAG: c-type cytochrome [Xanthomonadales bacterium]